MDETALAVDTTRVRAEIDRMADAIRERHERLAELDHIVNGGIINREQAREALVRLVSRPDINDDERAAVRVLGRRWSVSRQVIAEDWRRASGSPASTFPPGLRK